MLDTSLNTRDKMLKKFALVVLSVWLIRQTLNKPFQLSEGLCASRAHPKEM